MITLEKKNDMFNELFIALMKNGGVNVSMDIHDEFIKFCEEKGMRPSGGAISDDGERRWLYIDKDDKRLDLFEHLSAEVVERLASALLDADAELQEKFGNDNIFIHTPMYERIRILRLAASNKFLQNEHKKFGL